MLRLITIVALLAVGTAEAGPAVQVPAPATLGLLGAGAAAIALGTWWRNRRK